MSLMSKILEQKRAQQLGIGNEGEELTDNLFTEQDPDGFEESSIPQPQQAQPQYVTKEDLLSTLESFFQRPQSPVSSNPDDQRITELDNAITQLQEKIGRNLNNGYLDYLDNGQYTAKSQMDYQKDEFNLSMLRTELDRAYRSKQDKVIMRSDAVARAMSIAKDTYKNNITRVPRHLVETVKGKFLVAIKRTDWANPAIARGMPEAITALFNVAFGESVNSQSRTSQGNSATFAPEQSLQGADDYYSKTFGFTPNDSTAKAILDIGVARKTGAVTKAEVLRNTHIRKV